ncbi:hypothetical protein ACHAWF_004172, partial [Thalassiosira exigua]
SVWGGPGGRWVRRCGEGGRRRRRGRGWGRCTVDCLCGGGGGGPVRVPGPLALKASAFDADDGDGDGGDGGRSDGAGGGGGVNFIYPSSRRRRRRRPGEDEKGGLAEETPPSSSSSSRRGTESPPRSTMSTAVCVVPPDEAWDALQRARHLCRDGSFYRWPPAIRLFHPFAAREDVPDWVGKTSEWIDEFDAADESYDAGGVNGEGVGGTALDEEEGEGHDLKPFSVTLDSVLILPHREILDARIEELERRGPRSRRREYLPESIEDRERRERIDEGQALVAELERKGRERKEEWERKRRAKARRAAAEAGDGKTESGTVASSEASEKGSERDDQDGEEEEEGDDDEGTNADGGYKGPCVVYLAPDDASRRRLEGLRETLRREIFADFDPFSPGSSVSPYPERLPRDRSSSSSLSTPSLDSESESGSESKFRPLLPLGSFPTVRSAVRAAKKLQKTWDPLTFDVTDVQFLSRDVAGKGGPWDPKIDDGTSGGAGGAGVGFGRHNRPSGRHDHSDTDIPEVRHRRKHGTMDTATDKESGLATAGEEADFSRRGVYGCDAMVALRGMEPEEDLVDEAASLSMLADDEGVGDDDDAEGAEDGADAKIDYRGIFAAAEREYQRLRAHEELDAASYVGRVPIFEADDLDAWLDGDEGGGDGGEDGEGATVVVGRAQFFVGAMREFVG